MRRPHCMPVLWVLSLLGSITLTVLTTRPAAAQAPRAKIVSVEGAATTYQVEGMSGQLVTVEVPSQSTAQTASEHCLPQCGIKPIVLDARKY